MASLSVVAMLAGCNLSEPADNYAYQGPFLIISTDQGTPPGDVSDTGDMGSPEDMKPAGSPELVFTELMVQTSVSQPGLGERGEYIEIKNVGEGPADPTKIVMILADPAAPQQATGRIVVGPPGTPEEIDVVSSLASIQPGEYFVFVRFEIPEIPVSAVVGPGRSYDYGRFASGPALPNDARQIELRYNQSGMIETFDTVRWEGGQLVAPDGESQGPAIEVDTALGVDSDSETPDGNDDPKAWCPHSEMIQGGSALGSPGAPVDCGAG